MIPSAIPILQKHYNENSRAERFYRKCVLYEKKILLKGLYSRLLSQKTAFKNNLQKILLRVSRLERTPENLSLLTEWKTPDSLCLSTFHSNKVEGICFKMESEAFKHYQESLRKINDGEIREILLNHRHQIRMILEEMRVINSYII